MSVYKSSFFFFLHCFILFYLNVRHFLTFLLFYLFVSKYYSEFCNKSFYLFILSSPPNGLLFLVCFIFLSYLSLFLLLKYFYAILHCLFFCFSSLFVCLDVQMVRLITKFENQAVFKLSLNYFFRWNLQAKLML